MQNEIAGRHNATPARSDWMIETSANLRDGTVQSESGTLLRTKSERRIRSQREVQTKVESGSLGNYVVLYMPQDNGIDIVQVAHGARDLPAVIRRPAE